MSLLATRWNVEQDCGTATQDLEADVKVIHMSMSNSASAIDDSAPRLGSQAVAPDGTFLCGILKDDVQAGRARSHTTPWWLWWNILSLDAPTVAVTWALLLARPSHIRLRAADEIVLSLVVWCIYVSDRVFDGLKPTNQRVLRERHVFCAKHRRAMTWLLVLAAAAVLWVTADFLAPMEVSAGMKLAAIIGAYMATIHVGHGSMARFVPKELAVGILFAVGTTLPAWSRLSEFSWDEWIPFGLFAVLCSLNCLAIECWENEPHYPDWFQSRSPVIRWAETRINQLAAALAASAFAVILVRRQPGPFRSELLAISLAALLILLLNRHRNRLSGRALRVLADATLVLAGGLALLT
jgi:hypothetical protein